MGQTTNYHLPYPEGGDTNYPPRDIKNLCDMLDIILLDLETSKAETSVTDALSNTITQLRAVADASYSNVSYAPSTGILTFTTNSGTTKDIDLPLELLIEYGTYDSATKKIILTLANGDTIEIPVGDLVSDIYTKSEVNALLAQKANQADFEELQGDVEENTQNISDLDRRVNNLERTTGVRFEIERKIIDANSNLVTSTDWTRLYDAVGMVANATHDGTEVQNDFDTAPIYRDIISVEEDDNGNILHYYDEEDYDPTSGNNIMTILPDMYIARYFVTKLDGIYERRGVATQKFDKNYNFYNGREIARYEGCLENNKLRSISGKIPLYNRNINQFRTYAKSNGSKYGLEDIWSRFIIETLYLVEYASNHSQNKLGLGLQTFRDYACTYAESNTNRILVASNNNAIPVGRTISIGTSAAWNAGVAQDRIVTNVESVTIDGTTYTAYSFDGNPVNTSVGNHIWVSANKTGECDSLGMKSGCLVNDGNHSVIYRGIENPFGNMWEWIDGINLQAGNGTFVCRDYTKYASDKFNDGYTSIGYTKFAGEGWAKQMGYDENNPEIALPIAVGASDSTGYCDYYYNQNHTSNRVARVGGGFSLGTPVRFLLLELRQWLYRCALERWRSSS